MCTHIWPWLYTTMHAPTHKHTDARNLASALRHRLDPSRALSVEWTWMQKTCESQWVRCLTYTAEEETEQLFSSTCIDDPNLSKEPPPPRGGSSIYYVPWSRAVCKRFHDEMRRSHLVVKSLTHGSWSGNHSNKKHPREVGFPAMKM